MKKLSKYIIFIMILFVMTNLNIEALSCSGESTACKLCEYSFKYVDETITVGYKIVDKGNGNIELNNDIKSNKTSTGRKFLVNENVASSSFKPTSGNRFYCPALYYDVQEPLNTGINVDTGGEYKINISANQNGSYVGLAKKDLGGNSVNLSDFEMKNPINSDNNNNKNEVETGSSEGCEALEPLKEDIQFVWNLFKIAAPILVVIFGSLDFAQAVISNDNDAMKKATKKFSKRLMFAVALFFLPYLIELLFVISGLNDKIGSALCGII